MPGQYHQRRERPRRPDHRGTSGIGQATAWLLHQRGYQVMVTGQNPVTIAAATETLPEQVVVLRADARSLGDADRVVHGVRS